MRTDSDVVSAARNAAEQHIPLDEANDFEPGSTESELFIRAYAQACPEPV